MAEEPSVAVDALFLERLEALFEKSLADLRAFAQRERCSFEEVRKRTAEWHCQYLFEFDTSTLPDSQSRQDRVHEALRHTSTALESLHDVAGLQSFFLVVNPKDPMDEGFLGGTMIGREFWRGHRGCGTAGARAFKLYSEKSSPNFVTSADTTPLLPMTRGAASQIDPPVSKKGPAGSLKAEVYSSVRNALRKASGMRTAEMKWSNHAKLDIYGVRLVGWPASVPMQNPSSLSVAHNQSVLDSVRAGTMLFVPLQTHRNQVHESSRSGSSAQKPPETNHVEVDVFQDTVDFSWAGDDSGSSTPLAQIPSTVHHGVESSNQSVEQPTESIPSTVPEAPPEHAGQALFVDPSLLLEGRQTSHQRKRRREDSRDSQESPT